MEKLAIAGGVPIRNRPLPLEFPGVHRMGEEEVVAVTRLLKSRSLFRYYGIDHQHEVAAFEADFARFVGVQHAVAVSSGTGALHTALAALGVGPGQEVIVPAYLWVSVVAAVVNQGAIPVLADIDDTFCLDPAALERCVTGKTAGIILVHMSGAPGDAEAIRKIADRRGLFLLEDCAQCAGGSVNGRGVGTFGDMAIFSFQMNKNMTAGEGGAVVTSDARPARARVRLPRPGLRARRERAADLRPARPVPVGQGVPDGRTARRRPAGAVAEAAPRPPPPCARSKYRIRQALAGSRRCSSDESWIPPATPALS